jgi:hypothetical protein
LNEDRLRALDAALATAPRNAELHFERARTLERLRRRKDALAAYVAALELEPSHFGALTDLAIMLYNSDARKEAFDLFEQTIGYHPRNATAQMNFAYVLLKAGELRRAQQHYETALTLDPENAEARRGLATVATQLGERPPAGAQSASDAVVALPFHGEGAGTPLLLLCSLGAGNVNTGPLLDDRIFAVSKLIVELFPPDAPLPEHRLAFNAIGDADAAPEVLASARVLLAATRAPVVNPPERVIPTGRAEIARRLAGIEDVVTARTELRGRAQLAVPGRPFPLLVRSPGFHTGEHFTLVEEPADWAAALAALPGDELYVMQFVDTRDAAGLFRKYRVMSVDGELYPLHLAISPNWKVHYYSAEMSENAAHRALDRAFLDDMAGVLGARAVAALHRVAATLGLDYAGIDFGIDAQGRVVVFEANATMIVPMPGTDERWDYRRPAVERVCSAVRAMLVARAAAG